jgi:hypothetical protein
MVKVLVSLLVSDRRLWLPPLLGPLKLEHLWDSAPVARR